MMQRTLQGGEPGDSECTMVASRTQKEGRRSIEEGQEEEQEEGRGGAGPSMRRRRVNE